MRPRLLRSPRAAGSGVVLAVALAFGLSACTPDTGTAPELRDSVVEIAERSAAGDFAGALAELELLVNELDAAVKEGKIDAAHEREIRAAIDLVRADLEAAMAANTPAPAPTDDEADDDDGNNGGGNDGGNGNSGNSGNSGNGNGGNSGGGSGDGDQSTAPATEPPATEPPATEPPATEPPATEGTGDGG